MKYFGILLLIVFHLSSCTKDKTPPQNDSEDCLDIEEPGLYFPGFPETWWKFIDQNNDTVLYSISADYEKCGDKCRPIFLNLNKCISNTGFVHNFYSGLGTNATVISPIYSMVLDSVMICPVSFATFQEQTAFLSQNDVRYRRITTKLDTTLVIDGVVYQNVLQVYEFDKFNVNHRYFDYFAKNIGLVKRDSLNMNDTTDHIEILKIKDYFIGN